MKTYRIVQLFRLGRNQAVRIPREFELQGGEASMRREGDRLVLEPIRVRRTLREVLDCLEPIPDFPDIIASAPGQSGHRRE